MFVPIWLLIMIAVLVVATLAWAIAVARGRNPLPFPDPGSRIFSAASPEAKAAIVDLLAKHGIAERCQFDSSDILRSILWDGTIINVQPAESRARLGDPAAGISLVAKDPQAAADDAVAFLRARGFQAEVVPDVEPGLPIAFVRTDAFAGSVLNFRKHVIHMPRPGKG